MGEKLVFFFLTAVFFVIYYKILIYIYDNFVPYNALTTVLSFFIIIIIILPLAVFSADKIIKVIKQF